MSFDVRTIIKLVNAGFNAEEIEDILAPKDTNGSAPTSAAATPTPAAATPTPAAATPTPAAATPTLAAAEPTPAAAEPTPAAAEAINIDDLKNTVNEGFKSIIEALQVSAVGGSSQNMPVAKTSEDILAEIISPFDK